nr:YdcF family protein [Azospirillum picis]
MVAVYVGLHVGARHLLTVRTPLNPADAIVVLGGEAEGRPDRAAALYRAGLAPRVIVSGDGDCREAAARLRAGGVAPDAILVECRSGNTAENAAFSSQILRALGARSVIVVTSWWHTARALRCFERSARDMVVMMAPSAGPPPAREIPGEILGWQPDGEHVRQEYLKTFLYRLPGVNRC